jgi:thiol-disulfide isomerase/thioredoxin
MNLSCVFSAAFLMALPICGQECEAPPDVAAAIKAAQLSPQNPLDERIAAARNVRNRFSEDYFAHRFYQDMFLSKELYSGTIQSEYRALLDEHPDNLLYQTLYARTLKGTNTPESLRILENILRQDSNYVAARLKLIEIYSAPKFRDEQKLAANQEAYWQACPESLHGFVRNGAMQLSDPQFNAKAASHLRHLLDGRTDTQALGMYNLLWTMEFKAVPLSEQKPVREQLRRDAAMLRSQDLPRQPSLLNELSQAYTMLGDKEGSNWVEAEKLKRGVSANASAAAAITQWHSENPWKNGFDRDEYQSKLLGVTGEWIGRWPDEAQPRFERFQVLRMMQDAPLEDTVSAAEDWIRVYEKRRTFVSPYTQVAQFYSQHNIRYSELPELVEKGLKSSSEVVSDLYFAGGQAAASRQLAWGNLNTAASIYLKLKKLDRARELLAQLGPSLLKERPPESAAQPAKQQFAMSEYAYWTNMAKLARADGNKNDALSFGRNALLANPFSRASAESYETASLRELWRDVKGTNDGFDTWLGKPESSAASSRPAAIAETLTPWTAMDKQLPDFEISDAAGKTWRLADFKDKVTLVNLWATWCGPCRQELPVLQKLFDRIGQRKDLQIITLNTDENPGVIDPFLKENAYTFPVLPASGYVAKVVPELSIPRNWIVDAGGVLRMERIGFSSSDSNWAEAVIAEMEKVSDRR